MTDRRGFTLVELMVVLGLISVIVGFGVGFLQRGANDLTLAQAALRDQFRVASVTARTRGLPTEVASYRDQGTGGTVLRARTLTPIGLWHLEPDESVPTALVPRLGGTPAPGRFGAGIATTGDSGGAAFAVRAGSLFDIEHGFAFRVDVRPDRESQATVARMGQAFQLEWDGAMVPGGRVTIAAGTNRAGPVLRVTGRRPVPLHQWSTLELVHDGRRLTLLRDGVEEGQVECVGVPFQTTEDHLELSPPETPMHGVVDEVQLLAYTLGEPVRLPSAVELRGLPASIPFDRLGMPMVGAQIRMRLDDVEQIGELKPGGILRWTR